jgi:hypothetical protein
VSNTQSQDLTNISPCNHEEADTRIMLHVDHAVQCGYKKIIIRTVDSDVVVLGVALVHKIPLEELWIQFGVGKSQHYIAVHDIAKQLGIEKSLALPMFHALTGCDTTSSFYYCGKNTAWEAWEAYPELTDALLALSEPPCDPSTIFAIIERFIIIMYDRTSDISCINAARNDMFCAQGRVLDKIPPTKGALEQHVNRAIYQGGYIWGQMLKKCPILPEASDWGWKLVNEKWRPHWTNMPMIQNICTELIKCGCKTGCKTKLCKCRRNNIPCILRCACKGTCGSE